METSDLVHESAAVHVLGEAVYVNDMDGGNNMLTGYIIYSKYAHAMILSCDISEAKKVPGVHAVLTADDIPGDNQMGPVVHDEPCLAGEEVTFIGQAIVLIAADSPEVARQAAGKVKIEYEQLPAITTISEARAVGNLLGTPRVISRGDAEKAYKESIHKLSGSLTTGAQEHWYLETHSCLCVPGEESQMTVYSSTQHPAETQAIVAEVLGVSRNNITVEVRRMGGAFGGKETQANHIAAWTALLAKKTHRPVKIHLFRDDDQIITGKRHPFEADYKIGFDDEGIITSYILDLHSNAGSSTDLSLAILERAVFHADNAYYIRNISVTGKAWKTNLPSNTAFRGFGGPQSMAVIENALDRIARYLKKDPAIIRFSNFYGIHTNNTTHYEQEVENNRLSTLFHQLCASGDYFNRRRQVEEFNLNHKYIKRGLAITPVKFGISFTTTFLNQAGALINIYQDGTVLVNHGGTEMGQGLQVKMLQVAANELGVSPDYVKITATNTSKVPNTSATAASSGSDLNGMAIREAAKKLKQRMAPLAAIELKKRYPNLQLDASKLVFTNNHIHTEGHPDSRISFKELVQLAYLGQVSLSATGYYKTPGIHFDKIKGRGKPFHYFAFGMAVAEVEVDMLTGNYKNIRTDILHDVGNSLNRNIDIGQIEGGFIQGVGWCTTEVIKWTPEGVMLNHSPDTYKIPTVQDIPHDFRVALLEGAPNPNTIGQSKAVGEPPFMLCFSVWLAIKDALSAVADHAIEPPFSLPASNEVILKSARFLYKSLNLKESKNYKEEKL